jgi:hypothetical protein
MTHGPAGREYTCLEPAQDDHVHIRFQGPFQGKEVTWDARIVTLEHEHRARQSLRRPASYRELRQFIDVGESDNGIRMLRIGLNIERIDESVILKTIIMVRQYKRLREGRHEFGEAWSPAQLT